MLGHIRVDRSFSEAKTISRITLGLQSAEGAVEGNAASCRWAACLLPGSLLPQL